MSVLVTGAGGMVGSFIVEYFIKAKEIVIGTYYKPTIDISEIPLEAHLFECDVRYPDTIQQLIAKYRPAKIFHMAAQSYPSVSWDRPYETIDTNVNGTIAVFEGVKKVRQLDTAYDPMVVVACSSAEYGASLENFAGQKVTEDTPLLPLHPYGVSKVGQDLISYQYYVNDHIRCIRARIFNTTGPRKVQDVTSDFVRRALALTSRQNGDLTLTVGNIETYRAIMDVRDLVSALVLLSEKGQAGEVYNICSENVYQVKEIIKLIEKLLNVEFKLSVNPQLLRPTDEKIILGDVTKLKQCTAWQQTILFEQTVKDMLEYYRWKNYNKYLKIQDVIMCR